MTQQQQINLLTSIMPEISETHDPRGVMLKCAKEHNLSPAQLEKLGHVYNTAKTLVGLEKQAHRGDSFSIVDVPEMVASYTTFDPTKEVARGSKEVHRRANRLLKYAEAEQIGYWTRKFMQVAKNDGVEKAATVKFPSVLDDIWEKDKRVVVKDEADGNQWEEIPLPGGANLGRVTKSAAASIKYVASQMTKAAEEAREAMVDANETSRKMVGEIRDMLLKSGRKEEIWPEMVEDLDDYYASREKSAGIAHYIESHLEYDHNLRVPHVDLEKRAGKRMIARDRHGIFSRADEIYDCSQTFKEAKALYESLTESNEVEDEGEEKLAALISAMKQPVDTAKMLDIPTTKEQKKWKEEAQSKAKQTAALQQLLLSDPVLQEADPHEVEDIYNTVSSLNSTIASDPRLLGPVLKESLQYGSVPIQMLKDIVSIDKDRQQADKYREEVKDLKYNK